MLSVRRFKNGGKLMLNKWPLVDVKLLKTGTYEETKELVCQWCGDKQSAINVFNSGADKGVTDAKKVQLTAEYNRQYSDLYDKIQKKEVNQYEAAYKLTRLSRNWSQDNARGFAGSSEVSSHLATTCSKCNNPIGFDYKLKAKVENRMPEHLDTETWRSLPLPPREVIAGLLRGAGETGAGGLSGTVEDVIQRINPHRFDGLKDFMAKVEVMFGEATNIPTEFRQDFNAFLTEYNEWVAKEGEKEFSKYLAALIRYAEYAIAHDYPLTETHEKGSVLHRVAELIAPQKGVVAFPPEEGGGEK
jgi:hypothetical protein